MLFLLLVSPFYKRLNETSPTVLILRMSEDDVYSVRVQSGASSVYLRDGSLLRKEKECLGNSVAILLYIYAASLVLFFAPSSFLTPVNVGRRPEFNFVRTHSRLQSFLKDLGRKCLLLLIICCLELAIMPPITQWKNFIH